jgi:hypothetical protein
LYAESEAPAMLGYREDQVPPPKPPGKTPTKMPR